MEPTRIALHRYELELISLIWIQMNCIDLIRCYLARPVFNCDSLCQLESNRVDWTWFEEIDLIDLMDLP